MTAIIKNEDGSISSVLGNVTRDGWMTPINGTRAVPVERAAILLAFRYGNLDPHIGMILDSIFAELGRYDPLPSALSDFVTGKHVMWSNTPANCTFTMPEVRQRIPFERASIAFGCHTDNVLVGPFDIAHAMAAVNADGDYRRLFIWAITHVLASLHDTDRTTVAHALGIEMINDEDVLSPDGPLNPTYLEIAQAIRKTVIESKDRPPTEAERRQKHQENEMMRHLNEMAK